MNFERSALRNLKQLDLATRIDDMRAPPGNRLEALKGARAGQWSVRINDQYHVCFGWADGAHDVEIVLRRPRRIPLQSLTVVRR